MTPTKSNNAYYNYRDGYAPDPPSPDLAESDLKDDKETTRALL